MEQKNASKEIKKDIYLKKSGPFMSSAEKIGYIFVVVLAFIIGLTIGFNPVVREKGSEIRNNVSQTVDNVVGQLFPDKSNKVDEEEVNFTLFWTVWNTLSSQYVDKDLPQKSMFYGAIKGMVAALEDPVTIFLTPDETKEYEEGNTGSFEGIGAELGYKDSQIIVVTPLEGSPALEAGLRAQDVIVEVDGKSISGKSILEVVSMIRGKAGTKVKLTIFRDGESETRDIMITRGKITVASISYDGVDKNNIAVLDIDRFTEASITEWENLWDQKIDEIVKDNPKGLIIDLRGNPGGYFSGSIYAASEFLEESEVVVKQEDRDGNLTEYTVERVGKLQTVPIIVLVNEGSASASEILAGALQKNNRAKIVGVKTFGKGTAQDVIDYTDGSSLHITIYKWLLPDGTWINPKNTIEPDIKVELSDEDFKAGRDPQMDKAKQLLNK